MERLELHSIMESNAEWLRGEYNGVRANLRRANLRWANLSGANMRWADLSEADLSGADLSGADLSESNLSGSNLSESNLRWADLCGADLRWANLSGANLRWADRNGIKQTRVPLQIINGEFPTLIWDSHVEIGCSIWTFEEFASLNIDSRAVSFATGKPLIDAAISYHKSRA